ncbi:MAG: class I SAM-dependent methyltransferase [Acidobacteriota bacterium]|nr:class I SAM-dependent methyltransferase [Acidobacteriota bacterium]
MQSSRVRVTSEGGRAEAGGEGARATFLASCERGDRVRPKRHSRNYQHLLLLSEKMRRVVASPLLSAGERLLDFGCGNKPYRELFSAKFTEHVGADIEGNEDAEVVIGADGRLPVADREFDCVLSSQVLEHVGDAQLYLRESFRVLRPGGSLVLSTHGVWPYHPDPTDFWRWTKDGLVREISRAGFEVQLVQGVFGLESSALQLWQDATYGRLPRPLQTLYTWFFQTLIGLIERRHPDKLSDDASVYVVLARKPPHDDAKPKDDAKPGDGAKPGDDARARAGGEDADAGGDA